MTEGLIHKEEEPLLCSVSVILIPSDAAQFLHIGTEKSVFIAQFMRNDVVSPRYGIFESDSIVQTEDVNGISIIKDRTEVCVISRSGFRAIGEVEKADLTTLTFGGGFNMKVYPGAKKLRVLEIKAFCGAEDPQSHQRGFLSGPEIQDEGFLIKTNGMLIPICKDHKPENILSLYSGNFRGVRVNAHFAHRFHRDKKGKFTVEQYTS